MDIAGNEVTKYFKSLLRKTYFCFDSSSEFETIRKMKENECELNIFNNNKNNLKNKLNINYNKNISKLNNNNVNRFR